MNRGIILFAIQGSFDYLSLAEKCAKQIKKFSSIPVSVVTNQPDKISKNLFDSIITISEESTQQKRFYSGVENDEIHIWNNLSRCLAYDLTPYDHTLVIDVDYVVNSNFLFQCFDIDKDFLIFKQGVDLAEWRNTYEFEFVSQYSIPFYWATVFMFKKNNKNYHFFNLLKEIKRNWEYYRLLYQIKESTFRNDYAFSIAIHVFYNSIPGNFVDTFPSKMYYSLDKDHLLKIENEKMSFALYQDSSSQYYPLSVNNLDVHVMNKFDLIKEL